MKKSALLASFLVSGIALGAQIKSGVFTMLDEPFEEPNHSCYTGTSLTLQNGDLSGAMVTLTNFVGGFCELYVAPNERTYFLTGGEKDSCGSFYYQGEKRGLEGLQTITVTDNRFRLCDDLVPGAIVVEEKMANGHVSRIYSYDR